MSIVFRKLPISDREGPVLFNIFYVVENQSSVVMENFKMLPGDTKELVIDLIKKMATIKNFESPKIKYNLKGYNYGEIKPKPHRFFFFQKCGENYIFFDYQLKKKDSLGDKVYRQINQKKERYADEFQKFIQGN